MLPVYLVHLAFLFQFSLVQIFQVIVGAYWVYPLVTLAMESVFTFMTFATVVLYLMINYYYLINNLMKPIQLYSKKRFLCVLAHRTRILLTEHNRITKYINHTKLLWSDLLTFFLLTNMPVNMYPLVYSMYHDLTGPDLVLYTFIVVAQAVVFATVVLPLAATNKVAQSCSSYMNALQMSLPAQHPVLKYKVAMLYELVNHRTKKVGYIVGPFGVITKHAVFEVNVQVVYNFIR